MIKTFLLLSLLIVVKPLFIPISKLVTKNRPHKVEVLDKDLVIWWNKNTNRWCALDDMCRHRQSSLSKGVNYKQRKCKMCVSWMGIQQMW